MPDDETATTDPGTDPTSERPAPENGRHVEEKSLATRAGNAPQLAFGDAWDYAPAPERAPVEIADSYGLFIDGSFVKGRETYETVNPATEQPLAMITEASAKDVDRAVIAANEAQREWRKLPANERGKYLYRIARRIQERARELAVLETMDGGKPIKESRDADIPLVAQSFFYHAGWADKLAYAFPGVRDVQPVGVCGQIIPWNFPLLMLAWKIAPALACGNTVVLKPAETTPLTALRFAEICQEVGLPKGVVNIVTGHGPVGEAIARHPGIDKIAFTGSTDVGKRLARVKAERGDGVGLTLELGGKSPNIIFEDAAVEQAIEGIIQGIFFNQGHVCCAGSRLFVQESIAEEVTEKLRIRMASLRVGDPQDKNTDVGAINSKRQLERINEYIGIGEREGAIMHTPGTRELPERGYYCNPCFFTDVQQSHTIAQEEIFGPVLAVQTFRTPEEALSRANNTPYGLAAGVWTDKGAKMFDIARRLEAGVLWCNTFNKFDAASPFGGFKESGFGREGGVQGLRAYVNLK